MQHRYDHRHFDTPAAHSQGRARGHSPGVAATEHVLTISVIVLGAVAGAAAISTVVKTQLTPMTVAVSGDSPALTPGYATVNSPAVATETKRINNHRIPVMAIVASSMAIFAVVGGLVTLPYIAKKSNPPGICNAGKKETHYRATTT